MRWTFLLLPTMLLVFLLHQRYSDAFCLHSHIHPSTPSSSRLTLSSLIKIKIKQQQQKRRPAAASILVQLRAQPQHDDFFEDNDDDDVLVVVNGAAASWTTTDDDNEKNTAAAAAAAQTTTVTTTNNNHNNNHNNNTDLRWMGWMEKYQELQEFQQEHGHCQVPQKKGSSLGAWVSRQRVGYHKNQLEQDRVDLLSKIGFVWKVDLRTVNIDEEAWKRHYETLKLYKTKHGHCNVPRVQPQQQQNSKNDNDDDDDDNLIFLDTTFLQWIIRQRVLYNKGELRSDRQQLLDDIGFIWKPQNDRWQTNYKKLLEFKALHGHVYVPNKGALHSSSLHPWIKRQRMFDVLGHLDPKRKQLLQEIGIVFEDSLEVRIEYRWNEQFQQLPEYKRKYKNNNNNNNNNNNEEETSGSSSSSSSLSSSLKGWISRQRYLNHIGQLRDHRKKKLDSIGFDWGISRRHSNRGGGKNGSDGIPQQQQQQQSSSFSSSPYDELWEERYEQLKFFRDKHGHCNVKRNSGPLGGWVNAQRQSFRRNTLSHERKERLDDLGGFDWDIAKNSRNAAWLKKYEEIKAHVASSTTTTTASSSRNTTKKLHIPPTENKSFYNWILRQRHLNKAGKLEEDRKTLLDDLGMEW